MKKTMDDDLQNRKMQRYDLHLPSTLKIEDKNGEKEIIEIETINVCAGGCFLETEPILSIGTKVNLELMLTVNSNFNNGLKNPKKTVLKVSGNVIRIEKKGMAIHFNKNYQMKPFGSVSDFSFFIIGENTFQNELLKIFMENTANLNCMHNINIQCSPIINKIGNSCLVLFDIMTIDLHQLFNQPEFRIIQKISKVYIALFNASANMKCEKELIKTGIRGIFYRNESSQRFLDGILAILDGELRYPPKILSEFVIGGNSFNSDSSKSECSLCPLSPREKDILVKIAMGKSNKDVAKELNISNNTVRTHLYNIYKKIDVPNRLQATLWTVKYL